MTGLSIPLNETGYSIDAGPWGLVLDEEQTTELRWPHNIVVYDRMRRQDAQVISVLRALKLPVRRARWWVDPAGARDEVVQLVAEDLGLPIKGMDDLPVARTRDRFSWTTHLYHALLMEEFGHSFFEQVYRIDDTGRTRLRKLGWRPPRTISKIDVAADGGLKAIEQRATSGRKDPRIEVDRLVAYVADREGGNWLGASLLRPAYKFWSLKDRVLRVQAQSQDRNGMGVPIYTASPVSDLLPPEEQQKRAEAEIALGLEMAKRFRSGEYAGASIPAGATLTMDGVKGVLPDSEKPIRYYDEQIARSVLAHFLNLGTETGSWALGSTFADFFTLSLQTLADEIADVTTQHVVEDLVDLNWGPDAPAPRIVHEEIGSRHPATAEAIKALIDCGAITPDEELEAHLRTAYSLPAKSTTPPLRRSHDPVPLPWHDTTR